MGSIARKMTDEERKIFQELVDDGFTQFKDVIKQGRPKFRKDPAALDKLATGQVFTAEQALEERADRQDRLHRGCHRSGDPVWPGWTRTNVKVVKYKAEPRLSDILFGQSRAQPSFDLAALLEAPPPAPTTSAPGCRRWPAARSEVDEQEAVQSQIVAASALHARWRLSTARLARYAASTPLSSSCRMPSKVSPAPADDNDCDDCIGRMDFVYGANLADWVK